MGDGRAGSAVRTAMVAGLGRGCCAPNRGQGTVVLVEGQHFACGPLTERSQREHARFGAAAGRLPAAHWIPRVSRSIRIAAGALAGELPLELGAEPLSARGAE